MICRLCGRESWRSKFCRWCRNIKQNASSIVSQNKNKLRKLLWVNKYSPEWFDKFILYSDNITSYGKIVLKYQEVDTRTTFERIFQYGTIVSALVMIFFSFEIILISIQKKLLKSIYILKRTNEE